jgi:hypothetical protein
VAAAPVHQNPSDLASHISDLPGEVRKPPSPPDLGEAFSNSISRRVRRYIGF